MPPTPFRLSLASSRAEQARQILAVTLARCFSPAGCIPFPLAFPPSSSLSFNPFPRSSSFPPPSFPALLLLPAAPFVPPRASSLPRSPRPSLPAPLTRKALVIRVHHRTSESLTTHPSHLSVFSAVLPSTRRDVVETKSLLSPPRPCCHYQVLAVVTEALSVTASRPRRLCQ